MLLPAPCSSSRISSVAISTQRKGLGKAGETHTEDGEQRRPSRRDYEAPIRLGWKKMRCQPCAQFSLGGKEKESLDAYTP